MFRTASVWVSYPLKQGLKPTSIFFRRSQPACLSQLSIKTRIETRQTQRKALPLLSRLSQLSIKTRIETVFPAPWFFPFRHVWVSYPLKQGLKLRDIVRCRECLPLVWVSYPLKQGLKLHLYSSPSASHLRLSQLSIKTRIETWSYSSFTGGVEWVWVSYPLKQGLKPTTNFYRERLGSKFESAIH